MKHPVALNPNGVMGWVPKASLVADLCRRYSQIVAINFATEGDGYFLAVKDMLPSARDRSQRQHGRVRGAA
ncbi:MAG: hypothetical protein WDM84_06015 [Bauldia sp.]